MRKYSLFSILCCLCCSLWAQEQDLYDLAYIPEIKISFEAKDWAFKLDSLKQLGTDGRLVGDVSIDGITYKEVGIRYKGNSSYFNIQSQGKEKLPFNIKANYLHKQQRFPGDYQTLKLSNVFRDPSFLREVLSYQIANDYMPSPRANFARLYVNDQYLGLYNNTESVDEKFLKEKYNNGKGTLIKCDPDWQAQELLDCPEGDKASLIHLGQDTICYVAYYELKSDAGWLELVELTKILNEEPEKLEDVLDIDQTLWMLAFNNVLVNLDSYIGRLCHNYYLYKGPSGQFHPIVWDMNLSLGGFRYDGIEAQQLTDEQLQTLSPFIHYKQKNPKRPLVTNLLFNSLYRKVYVAHVKTIVKDYFRSGKYLENALKIQKRIEEEVKRDTYKLYDYAAFRQNLHATAKAGNLDIIGIVELMSKRTEYFINHPLFKQAEPKISEVKHTLSEDGKKLSVQARVVDATKAYLVYRKNIKKAFKRVELFDNGEAGDQEAADKIWSTTIDFDKNAQYYIIGEGKRTASLSPEKASFEFYEVEKEN